VGCGHELYSVGRLSGWQGRRSQVLHAGQSGTEQEHVEVEVTRLLVSSYFDIVRRNLQDSVPKVSSEGRYLGWAGEGMGQGRHGFLLDKVL
jgi:hypothetical protein